MSRNTPPLLTMGRVTAFVVAALYGFAFLIGLNQDSTLDVAGVKLMDPLARMAFLAALATLCLLLIGIGIGIGRRWRATGVLVVLFWLALLGTAAMLLGSIHRLDALSPSFIGCVSLAVGFSVWYFFFKKQVREYFSHDAAGQVGRG